MPDTFTHCLTVRDGLTYRCFIATNKLNRLEHVETAAGHVTHIFHCTYRDHMYTAYVRNGIRPRRIVDRQFSTIGFKTKITVYVNGKARPRNHHPYTDITIVKTHIRQVIPVSIDHDDIVVRMMARIHSPQVTAWVASFPEDHGLDAPVPAADEEAPFNTPSSSDDDSDE